MEISTIGYQTCAKFTHTYIGAVHYINKQIAFDATTPCLLCHFHLKSSTALYVYIIYNDLFQVNIKHCLQLTMFAPTTTIREIRRNTTTVDETSTLILWTLQFIIVLSLLLWLLEYTKYCIRDTDPPYYYTVPEGQGKHSYSF